MSQHDEQPAGSVFTPTCEQCGGAMPKPPKKPRTDQKVRFCKAKCRAKWHAADKRRKVEETKELLRRAQERLADL